MITARVRLGPTRQRGWLADEPGMWYVGNP